jgi:hypothetical protein
MFSCSRRRYLNSTQNNYSNNINININILFKLIIILKLNFIFLSVIISLFKNMEYLFQKKFR